MTDHENDRDEILGRLRERILRSATYLLSRDLAEDVTQEVLMLLNQKYSHLSRLEDLVPLSLKILKYKVWGIRRKSSRRGETGGPAELPDIPDDRPDPALAAERRQGVERLMAALAKMETRCQDLFRMKVQGLGFSEIQRQLGAATINTVYTWDSRCRKKLLERLGGSWTPGA